MNYLIVIILNDPDFMPEILKRWRELGVSGTTILKSEGGYATETTLKRFGLESLTGIITPKDSQRQRTIFSVIDDETLLEIAIAEAEEIVGGFDRPKVGLLFVIPVARILGLTKWAPSSGLPAEGGQDFKTGKIERSTLISQLVRHLELKPVIVPVNGSLEEALEILLSNPRVTVASVVNESGHLVGVLDAQKLTEGLLVTFLPEEFMGDLDELERVINVASRSQFHRISDLMEDPVSIHLNDTIKTAVHRMHQKRLTGLPVVDEHYHVVGHINLMELLAVWIKPDRGGQENEGKA